MKIAIDLVRPEDFFLEQHRRVFAEMILMGQSERPIDLVTLTEQLQRCGELESSGGAPYLSALADGMPRVSNVEHYARIVKEKALLRAGAHLAYALQQDFLEGTSPAAEISSRAVERLASVVAPSGSGRLKSYTPTEIAELTSQKLDVIAPHVAIRGMISTLDGPAKAAGKSTFLTVAIAAMFREEIFLNDATSRVPVLYVTEENPTSAKLLIDRAGLQGADDLHFIFAGMLPLSWQQLARQIARTCLDLKIGWLVVDTFHGVAKLGGDAENTAGIVDEALAPLRDLAGRLNIAVTLSRHTRKAGGMIGESGRGSSAFTGAVDTILELKRCGAAAPNRRRLEVAGRVLQSSLEIELVDRRYRIVSASQAEDDAGDDAAQVLAEALRANPQISRRALEKITGIGRNRISRLLKRGNWCFGPNGWEVLP